ncbi:MAG: glutamine-hydrolyzing GMP synthase [Actinomycetales bacterium]|nr:glutamine-hydrolyzing GMP synthase [Actinomycetales bacterium]
MGDGHALVLVVDFGAQYAQVIARRVREAGCYSEIVGHTVPAAQILAREPAALILSGGPASVYSPGAPRLDPALIEAGIPLLGICYGFQCLAQALGGEVARTAAGEYGATTLERVADSSRLLAGVPARTQVWMSHADAVVNPPPGVHVTARTFSTPVAAFEDPVRRLAGVQFHPEVVHTPEGSRILTAFLRDLAGLPPTWVTASIAEEAIAGVAAQVGEGRALCALSGGVDSAVAAVLVHRAIGDRLTCVMVDHGLLREGEREQVESAIAEGLGLRLIVVDARERFLSALAGVVEPEQKRRIIGRQFIRVFEQAAADCARGERIDHLVQGTLYPDVVESGGGAGTATIKSHHNVGGLPDDLRFTLVEPLRRLFKDEVREVGRALGLPATIIDRHPFPGPGLAIRIIGAVDADRLATVRAADAIARAELSAAGATGEVWQMPVVLLADVRSVGVQGDGRTYGHPVVLRPVTSEDAMTADWARLPTDLLARISARITNEVPGVTRVVLDLTSKPPGTIEWE